MRDDFSAKTKRILSCRVSFHCSNPACRQLTDGPALGAKSTVSIGEAAHICAASSGGPRYDATMTSEERSSYENGIWLCRNCAAMIDRDESNYTIALLHQWKKEAEQRAAHALHDNDILNSYAEENVLTSDEKVVLYYLLSKEKVSTSKTEFDSWCLEEELYDISYDNAYILLPKEKGIADLQLKIEVFREYMRKKRELLMIYRHAVDEHRLLSSYTIRSMWDTFPDAVKLLFAYSKEKNKRDLGVRWMGQSEIQLIKEWEDKESINNELSVKYGDTVEILIQNNIVYPSEWTSYGNARLYTYHKSAWEYLGDLDSEYSEIKHKYDSLPF